MAGEWIKMRADLLTSPKIVRIASALHADRLRVIGGMHAVWCLFDVHSEDGFLDGYTPEVLDEIIGWPGFSEAIAAVQWLEIGDGFLSVPRFDEHNGQSAKRRAQEAQRKAKERAEMSASDADKKRTREEKRRKENKEPKAPAAPVLTVPDLVADGVTENLASAWVAHRKAKRAPLTELAWKGFKREAVKANWTLDAAIEKAIHRNWQTFEASWAVAENDGNKRQSPDELQRLFARGNKL